VNEAELKALFLLADIPLLKYYRIENEYWLPGSKEALASPWWLVKFDNAFGLIKIGWRKRVIVIDWSDTQIPIPDLTDDDVTKESMMIHAWGYAKALTYLQHLDLRLRQARNKAEADIILNG
jgi:hypothetical protein